MTRDELARESRAVLEPLRRSPIGVTTGQDAESDRDRLVPRLEALIGSLPAERAASRRRRRWTQLAIAAAVFGSLSAALLVGAPRLFGTNAAGPGDEGRAAQGTAPQTRTSPLHNGDRFVGAAAIETQAEEVARFVTESGVELALGPASKARVRPGERAQSVELVRGTVSLEVPPLPPGSTLSVVTPEATVTVHGTRFSVAYDATGDARTCVQVSEGTVTVARRNRPAEVLVAGQASGCGDSVDHRPPSRPPEARDRAARPRSTLAQENRLLEQALAAEQRGDARTASTTLEKLLTRYPESPFAAEARRALGRLERNADPK